MEDGLSQPLLAQAAGAPGAPQHPQHPQLARALSSHPVAVVIEDYSSDDEPAARAPSFFSRRSSRTSALGDTAPADTYSICVFNFTKVILGAGMMAVPRVSARRRRTRRALQPLRSLPRARGTPRHALLPTKRLQYCKPQTLQTSQASFLNPMPPGLLPAGRRARHRPDGRHRVAHPRHPGARPGGVQRPSGRQVVRRARAQGAGRQGGGGAAAGRVCQVSGRAADGGPGGRRPGAGRGLANSAAGPRHRDSRS